MSLLSPAEYARGFRSWLAEHAGELAAHRADPLDFDARVANVRALQARLWDAGWAACGWPERVGGRGGNELHRAAFYEALADAGYPSRVLLEHLEIVAPTLARFGSDALVAKLLPGTLRADLLWCQGFSEPAAGSDLASLRTRAERIPGGFRIQGHKIWTSWARWADYCLLLARTGPPESRHRALSMFAVELATPGITCNVLRQANGTPEFAEVFFDGVEIGDSQLIGCVDGGWDVAMYLLSCERGSFGWQRHLFLYPRIVELAGVASEPSFAPGASADAEVAAELGACAMDAIAVRARCWSSLRQLASGSVPGPEAAVNKVLTGDLERRVYDAAARRFGAGLTLGLAPDAARWQESYLYSRAVGIYGGTRQIQLNLIARHLLNPGAAQEADDYSDLLAAARAAFRSPASGRAALEGLGFWESAGPGASGDARLALGALFEAQGRELAATPALGALLAGEWLAAAGAPAGLRGSTALRVEGLAGGRLRLLLPPGADEALQIVLWLPDGSAARVDASDCELRPSAAFDPSCVWWAEVDATACIPIDRGKAAEARWARSIALGRLCLCFEILGACEALLDDATRHAGLREQFGKPLMQFQAVQHLLAGAHVDRAALRAVCTLALARHCDGALEPELASLAKALAGRSGRSVAEHTLQVLGAIGFSEDHPHHRYMRRVLTLDSLLGSSEELARELGAQIALEGRVPRGPDLEDLPGAA